MGTKVQPKRARSKKAKAIAEATPDVHDTMPPRAKLQPLAAASTRRRAACAAWCLEQALKTDAFPKLQGFAIWPLIDALWQLSGSPRKLPGECVFDIIKDSAHDWRSPYRAVYAVAVGTSEAQWTPLWRSVTMQHLYAVAARYESAGLRLTDSALPWETREAMKLLDGRHKLPSWYKKKLLAAIPLHFAHVHPSDSNSVRFIADPRNGAKNPPTYQSMAPGRYLAKFYPELTDAERQTLAVGFDENAVALHITDDPKTIAAVYRKGPESCMSHPTTRWGQLPAHPTEVYGAPGDLALAYITPVADPKRVLGRALVWPAKRVYGRIYCPDARMAQTLHKEGWQNGSPSPFHGARIRAIRWEVPGEPFPRYVMPYIDWHGYVSLHKDREFWHIGQHSGPEFICSQSASGSGNGYVYGGTHMCISCRAMGVRGQTVEPLGFVCNECTRQGRVYLSQRSHRWVTRRDAGPMVRVAVGLSETPPRSDHSGSCHVTELQTWTQNEATEAGTYECSLLGYRVDPNVSAPVTVYQRWDWAAEPARWHTTTYSGAAARAYCCEVEPNVWVSREDASSWPGLAAVTPSETVGA